MVVAKLSLLLLGADASAQITYHNPFRHSTVASSHASYHSSKSPSSGVGATAAVTSELSIDVLTSAPSSSTIRRLRAYNEVIRTELVELNQRIDLQLPLQLQDFPGLSSEWEQIKADPVRYREWVAKFKKDAQSEEQEFLRVLHDQF